MASRGPTVVPDMGVSGIVSTGISVVTEDLRVVGLQFLAALVSAIPLLGTLLSIGISGVATQFADETLGNPAPENSLLVRFLYAVAATIVLFVVVFVGTLLFILPGIFLALKFSLVVAAVWIGDEGPLSAFKESWSRTKGHLLTILGVAVVFFVVALAVLGPAYLVFAPLGSADAFQEFSQQPLVLASPPLFAIQTLFAATVGAVGIGVQAVMYRSFGERPGVAEETVDEEQTEDEYKYGPDTEF